jgi:hypothetical protein
VIVIVIVISTTIRIGDDDHENDDDQRQRTARHSANARRDRVHEGRSRVGGNRMKTAIANVIGALALGGAGAYLMFGSNKGLGIFLVLVAAILCRILILGPGDTHDAPPPE